MKRIPSVVMALFFGVAVLSGAARANEFEGCYDKIEAYIAALAAESAALRAARGNPKARYEVALAYLRTLGRVDESS